MPFEQLDDFLMLALGGDFESCLIRDRPGVHVFRSTVRQQPADHLEIAPTSG